MDVGNQRGDLLFELPELLLKRIDIVLLIVLVIIQLVVRPSVVCAVRLHRASSTLDVMLPLILFLLLMLVLFVNKRLDITLCVVDALAEFGCLSHQQNSKINTTVLNDDDATQQTNLVPLELMNLLKLCLKSCDKLSFVVSTPLANSCPSL